MAKSRGFFGTIGALFRWVILGLAALFAVALYINFTAEPPAETGEGELVLDVPPEETPVEEAASEEAPAAEEAPAVETSEAETPLETVADAVENALESDVEAATDEARAEASDASGNDVAVIDTTDAAEGAIPETESTGLVPGLDRVTIPGDDATYEFLSAFRRDDGLIEMVTRRSAGGVNLDVTRLVRCAPLEVGLVAEGDGARIDQPDMEPIVLGNAVATLAAMACGAMK